MLSCHLLAAAAAGLSAPRAAPPPAATAMRHAVRVRMTADEWGALDLWLQQQQQTSPPPRRLRPERTVLSAQGRGLPFFDALSFEQLGVPALTVAGLRRCGFDRPAVVQAAAFSPIASGEDTIIAHPAGSGKTLAYALPLVCHLLEVEAAEGRTADGHVRALVLVPSSEHARQTVDLLRGVANRKLRVSLATGGNKWRTQRERAAEGLEVLVATLGRLQAHLRAGSFSLSDVRRVVLDEADMAYKDAQLRSSWDKLRAEVPPSTAFSLVTSTMPSRVAQQTALDFPTAKLIRSAKLHMTRPGVWERLIACNGIGAADETGWDRQNMWGKRVDALLAELDAEAFNKVLVLCSSVSICVRLCEVLTLSADGVKVLSLHGGLDAEERTKALEALPVATFLQRDSPTNDLEPYPPRVLLSTERAMRGLDIPDLDTVFLFDFPREGDEYVRSIGKATRGERPPANVTFFVHGSQISMAKAFMTKDEQEEAISLERA
ncbi:hypothetical protein AB1Y20_013581 [Prymnesium parvum]|uniref:RNA helicase n=1 Tax=Prymnesium parvum TaxID=97485 RepID=A0AB34II96_PRYPA